jgi:hypothetical protein
MTGDKVAIRHAETPRRRRNMDICMGRETDIEGNSLNVITKLKQTIAAYQAVKKSAMVRIVSIGSICECKLCRPSQGVSECLFSAAL